MVDKSARSTDRQAWMIARYWSSVAAMMVIAFAGCNAWPFGSVESLQGNWQFTHGKSRVYEMSLSQNGRRISGLVCAYHLGGPMAVRQAAVDGDYPRMRFTDPLVVGDCEYDMRFDDDQDQIAGDCGGRNLVRFSRGGSGTCQGATPAPR
jgi:hypothetical protein